MAIVKDIFRILKNGVWDEHYFKTSADQVVYTKADGTASNVQKELDAQNSALPIFNSSNVKLIEFTTGTSINTEYDIPIPDDWGFWNTMLLNFSVVVGDFLRDGINSGAIESWHAGSYQIKKTEATNRPAWVLVYKFR